MAMIDRYKKNGGFVQLLKVIETCESKKREKLMEIIRSETPRWAAALDEKSISFERILNWKVEIMLEIMPLIPQLPFVTALKGLSGENFQAFIAKLPHQESRKIETVFTEINPGLGEIRSGIIRIISETREMIISGIIKLEKVDEELLIPHNYEATLNLADDGPRKLTEGVFDSGPKEKLEHQTKKTTPTTPAENSAGPLLKNPVPFNLADENRPEVLKAKIRELLHQLSLSMKQIETLKKEINEIKTAA